CHYWWLNIGAHSTSVKPLTWAFDDQITTNWVGGPGEILTAVATWGSISKFLACQESGFWVLHLQTGTDVPSGKVCVATQLAEGTSIPVA
ncbi:hypothetical protein FRB95_007421, partial [Tulasnella sp. JGI-2019a]